MILPDYYRDTIKDELPKELTDKMLEFLNELKDKYISEVRDGNYSDNAEMYHDQLSGIVDFLESIGLYAEYGWPGHRNEYIFADEEGVELYLDYCYQCREEDMFDEQS